MTFEFFFRGDVSPQLALVIGFIIWFQYVQGLSFFLVTYGIEKLSTLFKVLVNESNISPAIIWVKISCQFTSVSNAQSLSQPSLFLFRILNDVFVPNNSLTRYRLTNFWNVSPIPDKITPLLFNCTILFVNTLSIKFSLFEESLVRFVISGKNTREKNIITRLIHLLFEWI